MNNLHIQPINIEPSLAEQLVQTTILGLRQLEQVLGYEFEEAIDTIESLHALNQRGTETGPDMAEQSFELEGMNAMEQYEYLSKGGI